MSQVNVQGVNQGCAFQNDSHTGMAMSMNSPFVSLRIAKPTLLVEVVLRKVREISTGEESRLETLQNFGHLLMDGLVTGLQLITQRGELRFTRHTVPVQRVQSARDRTNNLDVAANRWQIWSHHLQPTINAVGQLLQGTFCRPPFFACRLRSRDCRTVPRASAMRIPGGCNGPP